MKPHYPSPKSEYHFEAQIDESRKFKFVETESSEVLFDFCNSSWEILHVAWITPSMLGMRVKHDATEENEIALVVDLDKDLVTYEDDTLSSVKEVREALDEMYRKPL